MEIVRDLGYLYPTEKSVEKKHFAIYECPLCGKQFKVQTSHIKSGVVKSCGCYRHVFQKERAIHGMRHTKLYNRWCAMITRTTNPNSKSYKYCK
jgi:transcription elongation factor Elf1